MSSAQVQGSVVFITGANRGIGKALVGKAIERGAKKVYASARDVATLEEAIGFDAHRVLPVTLDVTQPEQIEAAALKAKDTQILINNAGIAFPGSFMQASDLNEAYHEMEVNYFGALRMARAFAPHLKANGGGALVNICSVAGRINFPSFASYSASKAALHSLTQGLRAELALQNTFVAGVYPGPVDTDMAKSVEMEKETPENVAAYIYEALEKGEEDISPDKFARELAKAIQADAKEVEKQNAQMV